MNLFERHAQLNQLFQQSPVEAAYLSGSLVGRASFGEMIDVDIAILLAEQISADRFLDFQFYFLSELTRRLESESLDVVILNQASLLLKLQVIKYGQILYSRDDKKRTAFEARAVLDYLDFRQMDELQNQALSRRLRTPALALDREGLSVAIKRLRQATAALGALPADSVPDSARQAAFERHLLLCLEAIAQIVTLLCAGLRLPQPEAYAETLRPLARRALVPADTIAAIEPLIALRDDVLRFPERVDHATLDGLVGAALPHFAAFADAIERLPDHPPTLATPDVP